MLDASRAVGVATTLVSDTGRDAYVAGVAADYEAVRVARANKGQNDLLPLAEARANPFVADMALKAPDPAKPGLHVFDDWDLADLRKYIDWTPFFRAWELAGNYPGDPRRRDRRRKRARRCSRMRRRCSTGSSRRNG